MQSSDELNYLAGKQREYRDQQLAQETAAIEQLAAKMTQNAKGNRVVSGQELDPVLQQVESAVFQGIASERVRASMILKIGEASGRADLAHFAIEDGDSVEDFAGRVERAGPLAPHLGGPIVDHAPENYPTSGPVPTA